MARGRPPKPAADKELAGNPGRRSAASAKRPAGESAPKCPGWLGKDAKAEWRRVVPALDAAGLLVTADLAILVAYCQAFEVLRHAAEELERSGHYLSVPIITPRGENLGEKIEPNPALSVARMARQQLRGLCGELGMTPSSRGWVRTPPKADDDDGFDDFVKR